MSELEQQIQSFHYCNPMDVNHLLNHPAEEKMCYTPTEEDIINDITRQNNDGVVEIDDDDDDDDGDDNHEVPKISTRKAVEMLNLVETFWLQQEGDHNNFLRTIQKMKDEIKNIKHGGLVQTSILKYFSSS